MSLSDIFSRRRKDDADAETPNAPVHPTKALARFLATLSTRQQPVLLDLGSVVGSNVQFFGEQLGCKIFVEELTKDVDRHVRADTMADLPAFFATRFPQADESFDGIVCWDLFDYLDKAAAQALAQQLARLLKPDGALLAFFATSEQPPPPAPTYTKYVVVDPASLQYRPYPAARPKQKPLLNRDIQKMFEPLTIADQFLLKTNLREVLFKK